MILITKGETNNIIVTLKEAIQVSEVTPTYYLFAFQCDQSREFKYCVCQDLSGFPDRYSEFSITETSSPDNTAGEVELELTGFWSYFIYEQSSSTNLDPTLADNTTAIEVGKLKVIGTATTNTKYEYTYENTVYNG